MRTPLACWIAIWIALGGCAPADVCQGGRLIAIGDADACAYGAGEAADPAFACPADVPRRFDFDQTVCAPEGVDLGDFTDAACAAAGLECVPPPIGCPGDPPDLADCRLGATRAECPSTSADPHLACRRDDGACFWFHGCVARGFVPTACPATDACCIDGYPYGEGWRESGLPGAIGDSNVHSFLYGWGTSPWTRERAVVGAADGPLAAGPPSIDCEGGELGAPCGAPPDRLRVTRTGDERWSVLRLASTEGTFGGWTLVVEIEDDDARGAIARVCRVPFTDGVSYACHGMPGPTCATAAMVTVDRRDPSSVRASVHAELEDGTTIDATL